MSSPYDQILLFGDSILQQSCNQEGGFGLTPALQDAFIRRLDVVNRGLSGYNTQQALKVLAKIIRPPHQAKIRFMILLFGANDACLPNSHTKQGIPLGEYRENLKTICTHPAVEAHKPRIVVMIPPPVDEYALAQWDGSSDGHPTRSAERTKEFARAAREAARELQLPILDVWSLLMSRTGWKEGQPLPGSKDNPKVTLLDEFLYDGLHLTSKAYKLVFENLMSIMESQWPDQVPERLPFVLPAWDDGDKWRASSV
ncbi:GDSL Lipase/Acylhydrolase family protein [Lineolata rhizophorae]|uniref:GDSL Lipase/Acylhydrolase family protein n=1 Tax=Lineolata rhizophorae TaxID=578093 RepID=A0A6A6NYV1_9PEZI|nr:GDSL Lipase/Acylhydrolase family protein [Lineolata rhizophorae]